MVTRDEVKKQVCEIMRHEFGDDYSQEPETSLMYDEFGLDSLDYVDLVWLVEEKLDVALPADREKRWKVRAMTFGEFIDMVYDAVNAE